MLHGKAARRKPKPPKKTPQNCPGKHKLWVKRLDSKAVLQFRQLFLRLSGLVISVRIKNGDWEKGEIVDGGWETNVYSKWVVIPKKKQQKHHHHPPHRLAMQYWGGLVSLGTKWDSKDRPGKFGGPSLHCIRGSPALVAWGFAPWQDLHARGGRVYTWMPVPWGAGHYQALHPEGWPGGCMHPERGSPPAFAPHGV